MYKSVNEPNTFNFHDSELLHVAVQGQDMLWTVDWVGVRPENTAHPSEQELRTEKMQLTFRNFRVARIKIYGCSIHDAQGKIVQRIPDRELTKPQIQQVLARLQNYENWSAHLHYGGGSITENGMCIEMVIDEEHTKHGIYLMVIRCDAFTAEWHQYSNVQW